MNETMASAAPHIDDHARDSRISPELVLVDPELSRRVRPRVPLLHRRRKPPLPVLNIASPNDEPAAVDGHLGA
jgi:hypothetical protein